MHSFLKLIETFDTDNHARGVQFEKLCKWLLENDPMYKSIYKHVWHFSDWPNCWGADNGIDLIAEDMNGKVWAIQAKCYDPKYSIKKTDIDSFISESANPEIDGLFLIASTDSIGKNARGVLERNDKPHHKLMLAELLAMYLNWPESLDDLSTGTIKKAFTPKPYQQTAIDEVTQNLDSRGQLIMACGTGKTLTALWIAEELKANTVLVLLPSLLLLSSTLKEWRAHSKEAFRSLPVCSDDKVIDSQDAISLSTSDLIVPSTTDVDEIKRFMEVSGRKVIFSTYQSSERIAEAYRANNLGPIDLIIADEAHRCAGKANSAYSTVLDNEQIPAAKRLFMTATPRTFQSSYKKKASDSGVEVVSMDDETVFGPELHNLSFGEAIEQDLLTDYQVVVVGIDNPRYSSMITERTLVKTDTDIQSDAQSFASHIGLAKAIKKYDLKRVISFHSRVSAAKDFANKLPEVVDWMPNESKPDGELITNYVSGAMPTNERNRNLQALGNISADQRYILSNARCLSEGVDVPALDGVAFIDPRNSEIDIVQAVGRAIRLSTGKTIGSIVIPVFMEDHEDPDEVLNSSPFKKVWAVVNALRSHDEVLGQQLDQLRQAMGKRGTVGGSDKIIFDLPTTITQEFQQALEAKLIESTTASWEFWFGLLELYKEESGDCLVDAKHTNASGFKIGSWINTQRARKDHLTPERIERLNALGFVWDPLIQQWEQGFRELVAYKKEFGDCLVAWPYITASGFKLGGWIAVRRTNKDQLTPARIKRLNALGFVWDPHAEQWEKGFRELVAYKEEFGDCLVTQTHITASGFKLGGWVSEQRTRKDLFISERIERLNALGFVWDPIIQQWEQGFRELVAYKKEFGDCLVAKAHIIASGYKLGVWIGSQRTRKDHLTPERIERLNALGFVWDPYAEQWEKGFRELVAYKEELGDCLVPQRHTTVSGFKLGPWIIRQRTRKDNLTPERIERLDALGFVWDRLTQLWEKGFRELVAYKEEFGDCLVPQRHTTASGFKLGPWIGSQRARTDHLTAERIERLDALGFVWKIRKTHLVYKPKSP